MRKNPPSPSATAADLRVSQIADDGQRLVAGGGPVRQLDALLVGHDALTEAEMEKITRHDLTPLDKVDGPIPPRGTAHRRAAVGSIRDVGTALIPKTRIPPGG